MTTEFEDDPKAPKAKKVKEPKTKKVKAPKPPKERRSRKERKEHKHSKDPEPRKIKVLRKRSFPKVRLLGPVLIVLLAVTAWPLCRAVYNSFFNYPFTSPDARTFVGIDNYRNVVTSADWWQAVSWAMAIMVLVVIVQLLLGFVFANVLNHVIRAAPIARILVLLPFAAMSFLVAFSWREALNDGYLNEWFRFDALGDRGDILAICFSEIWRGTGIVAVILLAGLMRIPSSLMEAAVADGAKPRQRFTRIVLPAVAPAAAVAIVYRALDALRMFEAPFVTGTSGSQIQPPQTWIFDTSLTEFEFGLGATMSIVFFLVAALVGAVLVRALRVERVL